MSDPAVGVRPVGATPGAGGYVLAVAVSVLVLALEAALPEREASAFLGVVVMVTIYGAFFCLPFAVPGVLLVHLACRRVRNQAVHVAAAGLAGVLSGLLLQGGNLLDGPLTWMIGLATAVGRASVIPFARARLHA